MSSKLITGLAMVIGLVIAISMAVQVGQGEFKTVYITTLLLFAIPTTLILGLRSWYILPFAMVAELPAIPLFAGKSVSLSELGISLFSFVIMIAFLRGQKRFQIKFSDWWPMLFYGAWVMMIAVINGGGLSILGSSVMGGRRYLTVMIAVLGMVMLSHMSIRDREARRVCWIIFTALSLTGIYMALSELLGRVGSQSTYSFYSWQQGLSLISIGGVFLLFARNSPSFILKKPTYLLLYLFLLVIAVYSGKRMNFAACCVIPVMASFWHRQAAFSLLAIMLGGLAISGVILVQNNGASLPKSLQRVLHVIPADWDSDVDDSTNNIFRDTLHSWAWKSVHANPILGKGVVLTAEDYRLMNDKEYIRAIKDPDDDVQAFPHIAGKNWHSTWLGLSASFGIPCAIIWGVLQIYVLRRSWKLGHHYNVTSWQKTLLGFIFFMMVYGVMRSLSSGDVAVLAMEGGLYLGLMSAIKNGLWDERVV